NDIYTVYKAVLLSKRAMKVCYRLKFEIPPRNSAPQIHRRNFVLKSSDGIYARSCRILKFRSLQA
ncbi:hypothetical protein, partial [uncultured Campylobacter sp.]|uniref:hypothetical protein n=1 Tax=uncultured Campylobacter sp. TaxID=218934 RepID=UPI002610719E